MVRSTSKLWLANTFAGHFCLERYIPEEEKIVVQIIWNLTNNFLIDLLSKDFLFVESTCINLKSYSGSVLTRILGRTPILLDLATSKRKAWRFVLHPYPWLWAILIRNSVQKNEGQGTAILENWYEVRDFSDLSKSCQDSF